jgi:hypothetical protein
MASRNLLSMEVEAVPDTDTDGDYTTDREEPVPKPQRARLLIGSVPVVALLCAAVATTKSFGNAQPAGGEGSVSLATATSATPIKQGCSNWDNSSFQAAYFGGKERDACLAECAKHADCKAVNYQPTTDCTGDRGAAGSCYLFKDGCKKESNDCWEFYAFEDCKQTDGTTGVTNSPCKCGTSTCPKPAFSEPPQTCDADGVAGKECQPLACDQTDGATALGNVPCQCGDKVCSQNEDKMPQTCKVTGSQGVCAIKACDVTLVGGNLPPLTALPCNCGGDTCAAAKNTGGNAVTQVCVLDNPTGLRCNMQNAR